jgi:hypothetical protein
VSRGRPEHDLERGQVAPFYGGLGVSVYATSARVWAKGVTPGIADLDCFFTKLAFHFYHETKVPGKRQSEAQRNFERDCIATGVPYVLGGMDEAFDFIEWLGLGAGVNETICIFPRENWPTKKTARELLDLWPSAPPNLDAHAKYGFRAAA